MKNAIVLVFMIIISFEAYALQPGQSRSQAYEGNLPSVLYPEDYIERTKINEVKILMNKKNIGGESFSKKDSDKLKALQNEAVYNNGRQDVGLEGLGALTQSIANGKPLFKANLIKYNLHLGSKTFIPFYLYANKQVESKIDEETIESSLLDSTGGLVNIKFAADLKKLTFGDICILDSFNKIKKQNQFGCFLNYDVGVKLFETEDADGSTDYSYSAYAGIGFDAAFPITEAAKLETGSNPAGQMTLSIAAQYINSDSDEYRTIFLKGKNAGATVKLKDNIGVIDAKITFTVTETLSVQAGGVLFSTSDEVDEYTFFNVSYSK